MYAAGLRDQPSFISYAVCLRVLCWDQFCSSCTPWNSSRSLNAMVCRRIFTPTTPRYTPRPPTAVNALSPQVNEYVDAIATLVKSNRLQLNPDETEVLWCATSRRQHQLPSTGMLIDGVHITPVKTVRDLGICIDADLSMRMHVQKTMPCCSLPLFANCVRSADMYLPPHSRSW